MSINFALSLAQLCPILFYTLITFSKALEDERDTELEDEDDDDEYDSGGSGVALTPPDSPGIIKKLLQNEFNDLYIRSWSPQPAKEGLRCRRAN